MTNETQPTTEPWVRTPAIAAHLGVSEYTIRSWAKLGTIPGHKVGREWLFKVSEVDAHLCQPPADPWMQSARSRGRKRVV